MIKPNERLTRRRLLHELRQGAVLVRSFDVEHGTTWSLASGRGVAASKALAVLQDAQARWCGDCLWGEWPEDLAQTYRCLDRHQQPPHKQRRPCETSPACAGGRSHDHPHHHP